MTTTTTTETGSGLSSVWTWDINWDSCCTTTPPLGSRENIVRASPPLVLIEDVGGGLVIAIAAEISEMAGARNAGIKAVGDLVVWLGVGKETCCSDVKETNEDPWLVPSWTNGSLGGFNVATANG